MKSEHAQTLYIAASEGDGGGEHVYAMPDLKAPLVGREDTTSQLHFNNKIYARAPSCRDLVPPEITFTPAPGSTGSLQPRPSAPSWSSGGEGGGLRGGPGQLEHPRTGLEDCSGPGLG